MADIPEDPTIDALIGHRGDGENPQPSERDLVKQVLDKLTPEQRQMASDEMFQSLESRGPGLLVLAKDHDFYILQGHLSQRATLVPKKNASEDPFCDSMSSYSGVIVGAEFVTSEEDLLQRARGKPVAIISSDSEARSHGNLWSLAQPLNSQQNEVVYLNLLDGRHPEAGVGTNVSKPASLAGDLMHSILDPEELQEVMKPYEPLDSIHDPLERILEEASVAENTSATEEALGEADPLALIRILLESRSTGESSTDAIKKWVENEPFLHGWAELTPESMGPPKVRVGGHRPGEVFRQLGAVMDSRAPIPKGSGDYGPFVGLSAGDHWLGILPGNSPQSRRLFWQVLELLPQVENLVPIRHTDGSPIIEDPESRFERLLHSRIRSSERHGVLPGVLVVEVPGEAQEVLSRLQREIRATDWCEVAGNRIWILLDHPEPGTARGLSSRILKALPGIRGGGTIGACTGYVARQCMDRVLELLQSSDSLSIEEEGSPVG